jgi:hypothetical protein
MVDLVVPRAKLRETLMQLIDLLRRPVPPAEVFPLPSGEGGAGAAQEAPTP